MRQRLLSASFAKLHHQASSTIPSRSKHFVSTLLVSAFGTPLNNGSVLFSGTFKDEKASLLSIPYKDKVIFWFVVNKTKRVEITMHATDSENAINAVLKVFVAVDESEAQGIFETFCNAIENTAKVGRHRKQKVQF